MLCNSSLLANPLPECSDTSIVRNLPNDDNDDDDDDNDNDRYGISLCMISNIRLGANGAAFLQVWGEGKGRVSVRRWVGVHACT